MRGTAPDYAGERGGNGADMIVGTPAGRLGSEADSRLTRR